MTDPTKSNDKVRWARVHHLYLVLAPLVVLGALWGPDLLGVSMPDDILSTWRAVLVFGAGISVCMWFVERANISAERKDGSEHRSRG